MGVFPAGRRRVCEKPMLNVFRMSRVVATLVELGTQTATTACGKPVWVFFPRAVAVSARGRCSMFFSRRVAGSLGFKLLLVAFHAEVLDTTTFG